MIMLTVWWFAALKDTTRAGGSKWIEKWWHRLIRRFTQPITSYRPLITACLHHLHALILAYQSSWSQRIPPSRRCPTRMTSPVLNGRTVKILRPPPPPLLTLNPTKFHTNKEVPMDLQEWVTPTWSIPRTLPSLITTSYTGIWEWVATANRFHQSVSSRKKPR